MLLKNDRIYEKEYLLESNLNLSTYELEDCSMIKELSPSLSSKSLKI